MSEPASALETATLRRVTRRLIPFNVAGFAGPYLVGVVKDATSGFAGALLTFALLMLAGAALALHLRGARRLAPA